MYSTDRSVEKTEKKNVLVLMPLYYPTLLNEIG